MYRMLCLIALLGGAVHGAAQSEKPVVKSEKTTAPPDSAIVSQKEQAAPPDSLSPTPDRALGEAVVRGSRVVRQTDRSVIFPTEAQRRSSATAYSLLAKQPLPGISVNEALQSVSSVRGAVLLYVDDVPASAADVQALDVAAIRSVEFIDRPGIRYGEDVAAVIRFVTRRATSGFVVGANGTPAFTTARFDGGVHAQVNRGRSAWSAQYGTAARHVTDERSESEMRYQMADGSTLTRRQETQAYDLRAQSHSAQLRYSLAESGQYTLQATLHGSFDRTPRRREQLATTTGATAYLTDRETTSRTRQGAAELYGLWQMDARQTLVADVGVTLVGSDYTYRLDEASERYAYATDGRTQLWTSEMRYENKLRPFTLSAGLEFTHQRVRNDYSGDVLTRSEMRSAFGRGYAQLDGRLGKFGYVVGAGLSRTLFRQGEARVDEVYFRPKLVVTYNFAPQWQAAYTVTSVPYTSRMQYVSDVAVQQDGLTVTQGNPALRPSRQTDQQLDLTWQRPRLTAILSGFYRACDRPVMQRIDRDADGRFVFTRENQRAIHMTYVMGYVQADLVPEKLTLVLQGSWAFYRNVGFDYRHTYHAFSGATQVNASLRRFTLNGTLTSGWRFMEGENRGYQYPSLRLDAGYRVPLRRDGHLLTLGLFAQQALRASALVSGSRLFNRYVSGSVNRFSPAGGRLYGLSLVWRWSQGRKYADVEQLLRRGQADPGIVQ